MTNNITLVQWVSMALIVLPIFVLWVNNRYLSARQPSTQMYLGAVLLFALLAAEKSSGWVLLISAAFFAIYFIKLGRYHFSVVSTRRHDNIPHCRRP